jgi:tRNA pseudouridine55 synthase
VLTPPTETPAGILAVDKPAGWTSHDAVALIRGITRVKRVGHGGTLDPLATGLLPVLVGSATRSSDRFHSASKAYAALVVFGGETATDDAGGETRATAEVPVLTVEELDRALEPFRGEIQQVPPDFAAVKVGGRRAYAAARAGSALEMEARTVTVHRLEAASWHPPRLRLLVVCGSGTYVRALARDIGRHVGSAAHLGGLRRLAVGALDAGTALSIDAAKAGGRDVVIARLIPFEDRLLDLDLRYRTLGAEELLRGWMA